MLIGNAAGFPWGPELALVPGSRLLPGATVDRKDQEILMGQSVSDEPCGPSREWLWSQWAARGQQLSGVTCPGHQPETAL